MRTQPPNGLLCLLVCSAGMVFAPVRSVLAQTFQEVGLAAGIDHVCKDWNRICGGVAFFDYDADGFEDLFFTGGESPDHLYRNEGDGTFRDVTSEAGLDVLRDVSTVGVGVGDIDADGFPDLFLTTAEQFENVLLHNEGDGTFSDISRAAGISGRFWSTGVTFGDYDLDGDLDIYVANYLEYDGEPYEEHLIGGLVNQLYRNEGGLVFTEVGADTGADAPGTGTMGTVFSDLDGDGDLDLYLANDFGYWHSPNTFLRNEFPEPRFTDASESSGMGVAINGMGLAVGDYDADGDLDLYVTNIKANRLFENQGGGKFAEVAVARGVEVQFSTAWGASFSDFDNDGHLDLVVGAGRVLTSYNLLDPDRAQRLLRPHANRLFRGLGGGRFEDVSDRAGVGDTTMARGLAVGDYDNDGDLDFAVAVMSKKGPGSGSRALLYRNDGSPDNNWLRVRLLGTISNRDGYGSRVEVEAGERRWVQEISGGSSYVSHHSPVAHFGLGRASNVDRMIITWPGGHQQILRDVPVNRAIRIVEDRSAVAEVNAR